MCENEYAGGRRRAGPAAGEKKPALRGRGDEMSMEGALPKTDAVLPEYQINFETAANSAKRLLMTCKERKSEDIIHLFHALQRCKHEMQKQVFFDPAVSLQKRQVHVNVILRELAFIELMLATRSRSIAKFPAVCDELGLLFELA